MPPIKPWDSYGVHQSLKPDGDGDMTASEARMLLEGRGCPSCKGIKPIWCEADAGCGAGFLKAGKCEAPEDFPCPYKEPQDDEDEENFLSDITDSANTDEDPVGILMDYEEKRRRRNNG